MDVIAYYRVSTKRQERSGLGLDGQKEALAAFAEARDAHILAEYTEVESGRRKDRQEIKRAIAHAKRSKAVLAVAKIDRLARNVAFLSTLMESGVDFVACDNPHANKFTIHVLAAVAEHEAEMISDRTKTALKVAKSNGVKLGSSRPGHWKGREDARRRGAEKGAKAAALKNSQSALEAYLDLVPTMTELRASGKSFRQIADALNGMGHTTRRGKPWNASQVMRVLRRVQE